MQKLRWPIGRRGREAAPEIKDSRAGPLIALTSGGGRARWPNLRERCSWR